MVNPNLEYEKFEFNSRIGYLICRANFATPRSSKVLLEVNPNNSVNQNMLTFDFLNFLCDSGVEVVDLVIELWLVVTMWYMAHINRLSLSFPRYFVYDFLYYVDTVLHWLGLDVPAETTLMSSIGTCIKLPLICLAVLLGKAKPPAQYSLLWCKKGATPLTPQLPITVTDTGGTARLGVSVQYIPRNMYTVLLCFALLWLCNRS